VTRRFLCALGISFALSASSAASPSDANMIREYLRVAKSGRSLTDGDRREIVEKCAAMKPAIPECDEIKTYLPEVPSWERYQERAPSTEAEIIGWVRLLFFILVPASAAWVFFDSASVSERATGNMGRLNRWGWTLGVLVVWIIAFPWYLAARKRLLREIEMGEARP
jgi:hypothetical protein